jgi:hypothetical protein
MRVDSCPTGGREKGTQTFFDDSTLFASSSTAWMKRKFQARYFRHPYPPVF